VDALRVIIDAAILGGVAAGATSSALRAHWAWLALFVALFAVLFPSAWRDAR
jgi:hypothetical protein